MCIDYSMNRIGRTKGKYFSYKVIDLLVGRDIPVASFPGKIVIVCNGGDTRFLNGLIYGHSHLQVGGKGRGIF